MKIVCKLSGEHEILELFTSMSALKRKYPKFENTYKTIFEPNNEVTGELGRMIDLYYTKKLSFNKVGLVCKNY